MSFYRQSLKWVKGLGHLWAKAKNLSLCLIVWYRLSVTAHFSEVRMEQQVVDLAGDVSWLAHRKQISGIRRSECMSPGSPAVHLSVFPQLLGRSVVVTSCTNAMNLNS